MLETLQIAESPARIAAVIRLVVPQKELPAVMGPAINSLMAVLATQGLPPAGPVFARYLSMDSGMFDFEVGVPTSAPVAPSGRVKPGQLPAAKVARTIYHGPYEGLHNAWHEFGTLVRAQRLQPAPGIWESYVVSPHSSPNPADWRTELNQPLLGSVEIIPASYTDNSDRPSPSPAG
jgi:effector-binding domain-containing protein